MENNIPTRNRLSAAAIFAPTEEERLAAQRLLDAGLFRTTSKDEVAWEDHPFNLAGLYPGHDSPFGKLIEDLVSQSEVLIDEDLAIDVTDKTPFLPLPAKPAPVLEEPIGESLKKLIQSPNPLRPAAVQPNWVKAEPVPPLDLGELRPMVW
jgi:hypothetical protein